MQIKIIQTFMNLIKSGWIVNEPELKHILALNKVNMTEVNENMELKKFLEQFVVSLGLCPDDLSLYVVERADSHALSQMNSMKSGINKKEMTDTIIRETVRSVEGSRDGSPHDDPIRVSNVDD